MEVREGNLSVKEFMSAEEVFISGTAVVVTPVGRITSDTSTATINNNQIGPVVKKLNELLLGIQYELIEDRFKWVYPIESK
jgi:branched-chain amino acid aminotransferase